MDLISAVAERKLGWLSPQGKFHECKPFEHTILADKILTTACTDPQMQLEHEGWVKLAWAGRYLWLFEHKHLMPTKRQWDYICDWCDEHEETFPPPHMEIFWKEAES